ncbi:hypothetical protein [Streptomyces sp. NRRL F-2747]|uniref:hypothetical protein n=1 Tax=Streptomyces sp. NRRL F-2747 TaxID=1463843 RepID=UPI000A7C230D|nr:hypothetical protein [Streptomyces sp. NRRL F-2747]
MAMQSLLRGFPSEAVDMAQGAFERAKGQAAPRVLAFTKLIEARAHARENNARAASRALAASEDLISQADRSTGNEPARIDFYHHARLSADAAEVFRDLKNRKASLAWNQRAAAMPSGVFTRSVGDAAGDRRDRPPAGPRSRPRTRAGQPSVDILARVQSSRAKDYVREFNTALARGGASRLSATSSTAPAPAPSSGSPPEHLVLHPRRGHLGAAIESPDRPRLA